MNWYSTENLKRGEAELMIQLWQRRGDENGGLNRMNNILGKSNWLLKEDNKAISILLKKLDLLNSLKKKGELRGWMKLDLKKRKVKGVETLLQV